MFAHRKQTADAIRSRGTRVLLKLAFRVLRGKTSYDPVEIDGRRLPNRRVWEARWDAIAEVIRQYEGRNVLDIGCAEAWFLRRAAEDLGCFAIGVDLSERRVAVGEIARLHDRVQRLAVMNAKLGPEELAKLPACDIVLCLSVVHHVINKGGQAAGEQFVKALSTLPRKALVFEMGGADTWAGHSTDPDDFVKTMLTRAGFTNIRIIARTPNTQGKYMRSLFVAEPAARDQQGRSSPASAETASIAGDGVERTARSADRLFASPAIRGRRGP